MSTFIAVDRSGRQVCEGETIYWAGRERAVFLGVADPATPDGQPSSIKISWETDPKMRTHHQSPRTFELTIIEMPDHSDYRASLAELKLRIELRRMTAELNVLPGTNPPVTIEVTWFEALALEMALGNALA